MSVAALGGTAHDSSSCCQSTAVLSETVPGLWEGTASLQGSSDS